MKKRLIPALILCGFLCGSASAATSYLGVDPRNTVTHTVANGVFVDGEGLDWIATALIIELTSGSIYNVPAGNGGSDTAPTPFLVGFNPDLEFDTYVGIIGGVNDVGPHGPTDLGSPFMSFSGQLFSAAWGNTDPTNTGPTLVGNITLTPDAEGTWRMLTVFAGDVVLSQSGLIGNGAVGYGSVVLPPPWPEPGMLALLGIGGLGLLRRSRAGG